MKSLQKAELKSKGFVTTKSRVRLILFSKGIISFLLFSLATRMCKNQTIVCNMKNSDRTARKKHVFC